MSLKKLLNLKNIIFICTWLLILLHLLCAGINTLSKLQNPLPNFEPGYEFEDFKDKIKGEKIIGFLTNRDTSAEKNDQEFLLAQYMLAPVILDLNNPQHKLLILDYTSPIFLGYKLKELSAVRLYDNSFNKVLAVHLP